MPAETVELATKAEVDAVRGQLEAFLNNRAFGREIVSGDGSAIAFTIEHGLESTPGQIQVTAGSPDGSNRFYVTADETNIVINFITAPPSGSGNLIFYWQASL